MMIIGIPVDGNSMEANVSTNFGRARFFLIHNTENGKNDFVENTAAQDSSGAGIKAAQIMLDRDVGTIITPQLGVKAFDVIDFGDIGIYESIEGTIEENINSLKENTLSQLNDIHEGYHRGGYSMERRGMGTGAGRGRGQGYGMEQGYRPGGGYGMGRCMDYGPGRGPRRGFGMGRCMPGRGHGRGFPMGRHMGYGPRAYGPRFHHGMDYYSEDLRFEEDILREEKAILEERLEEITEQLEGK